MATPNDNRVLPGPLDEFMAPYEEAEFPHLEDGGLVGGLRGDVLRAFGQMAAHFASTGRLSYMVQSGDAPTLAGVTTAHNTFALIASSEGTADPAGIEQVTFMVPTTLSGPNIQAAINIALSKLTGTTNKKIRCKYDPDTAGTGVGFSDKFRFFGPSDITDISITEGAALAVASVLKIRTDPIADRGTDGVSVYGRVDSRTGGGGGDSLYALALQDLTDLEAVVEDDLKDKMAVLVEDEGWWRFDNTSATAPDVAATPRNIVRPTARAATNGRFFRMAPEQFLDSDLTATRADLDKRIPAATADTVAAFLAALDNGMGFGGQCGPLILGATVSMIDLSAVAPGPATFGGINIDSGPGAEDINLIDDASLGVNTGVALNTAQLIEDELNAAFAASANNTNVRAKYVGTRWYLSAPAGTATLVVGAFGGAIDLAEATYLELDYNDAVSQTNGAMNYGDPGTALHWLASLSNAFRMGVVAFGDINIGGGTHTQAFDRPYPAGTTVLVWVTGADNTTFWADAAGIAGFDAHAGGVLTANVSYIAFGI
jgi:hypothetical protein